MNVIDLIYSEPEKWLMSFFVDLSSFGVCILLQAIYVS